MSSLVEQLANAIARMETGNFNPQSLGMRNNNPGNLRSWGSYPVVNGYVQFPDYATGLRALQTQVQRNIDRGLTLTEFFSGKPGVYAGYAPAADSNNPQSYARTVAGWLGISPDVKLAAVASAPAAPAPVSSSGGGGLPDFLLPAVANSGDGSGVPPAVVAAAVIGGASLLWLALS